MRTVICYPIDDMQLEQMRAAAPDWQFVDAGQERVAQELLEADVFCGHAKVPVPWTEVVRRGRLRWIQSSAAGIDHCLTPEVIDSDILVTSASGLFANQVAEQTLTLLLGLIRSMPRFFKAQQAREFIRRPTRDLCGSTVGIAGFGGNGRRLAEVLHPLGVRILATDDIPQNAPPHVEQVLPPEKLWEILPELDVLVLCVPLTSSTHHLIGQPQLARLKPGALLVNVARGEVVDEAALVHALESGQLGGAGLDVTEEEPLPVDSRLWDSPNVIITPHVGAQSARRVPDTTRFFCANLQRYQAGKKLLNLVDKRKGFPVENRWFDRDPADFVGLR